eukprot:4977330-Ditylum_brightwellii.AAC.1
MGSWQRLGMFCQVSEVQKTGFKSWTVVVEGGICCCAICNNCVRGWVKLDADGTMKKGCESMLQNPMSTFVDVGVSGTCQADT